MTPSPHDSTTRGRSAFQGLLRRWWKDPSSRRRQSLASRTAVEAIEVRVLMSAVNVLTFDNLEPPTFEQPHDVGLFASEPPVELSRIADDRQVATWFRTPEEGPPAIEVAPPMAGPTETPPFVLFREGHHLLTGATEPFGGDSDFVADAVSVRPPRSEFHDADVDRVGHEPSHWERLTAETPNNAGESKRLTGSESRGAGPQLVIGSPRPEGPRGAFERRLPMEFAIAANNSASNVTPFGNAARLVGHDPLADDESREVTATSSNNATVVASPTPNPTTVVSNKRDFGGLIDISENRSSDAANRESPARLNGTVPATSGKTATRNMSSAARRTPPIFVATREGGFIELAMSAANVTHDARGPRPKSPVPQRHDQLDAAIGRFVAFERADDPLNGRQISATSPVTAGIEPVDSQPSGDNTVSLVAASARWLSLGLVLAWLKVSVSRYDVFMLRCRRWRRPFFQAASAVFSWVTKRSRHPDIVSRLTATNSKESVSNRGLPVIV